MADKEVQLTATFTYYSPEDRRIPEPASATAPYTASVPHTIPIPSGLSDCTSLDPSFGSVAGATAMMISHDAAEDVELKVTLCFRMPKGAKLIYIAPGLPSCEALSSIGLQTKGSPSEDGSVAFEVFGAPDY